MQKKTFTIPLKIALCLLIISKLITVIRFSQNPFFEYVSIGSLIAILALYPFRFAKKQPKDTPGDHFKLSLVVFWCADQLNGALHLFKLDIPLLAMCALASLIGWQIILWVDYFKIKPANNESRPPALASPSRIGSIALSSLAIGAMFKIQHLPYANILMIIAAICLCLWIFEVELQGLRGRKTEV